jgi:hypothetical protein
MNVEGAPADHPFRGEAAAKPGPVSESGRAFRVWVGAALAIVAGSLLLARSVPLDGHGALERLGWIASALGWCVALWLAPRVGSGRPVAVVLVVAALAIRAPWSVADPGLSDDIERYVWEGGLVGVGVDVTRLAPDSPALTGFRVLWGDLWERVAHREVPAAYPPLTLLVHAAAVSLGGGGGRADQARTALRWGYGACDLVVLAALLWLLRSRGASPAQACAWGWSPLVAMEFLGAGHLDALAIALLMSTLALASGSGPGRGRERVLGALLALGGLAKLLPAVVWPFVARGRRPARLAIATLVTAALVLGGYALQVGTLPRPTGLEQYALRWESFSLLFRWIEPLFGGLARDESWSDPRRLARGVVLLGWLAVGLCAWRRGLGPVRATWWLVGAFLVLTPTLHPWYLTWIVPLLALYRSVAWTGLLAVAPLLYWPVPRWRTEAIWEEPVWLWPLVAGPFLVALVCEILWRRRLQRP